MLLLTTNELLKEYAIIQGITLGAVSYTHLDVYKRQVYHRARGKIFCNLARGEKIHISCAHGKRRLKRGGSAPGAAFMYQ